MNIVQNAISVFEKEINAGGVDDVPPTCCLPAAYVPAYTAALAEGTGSSRTKVLNGSRAERPFVDKSPICHLEHAA